MQIYEASAKFQVAFGRTGFMFPPLAFSYVASACALCFHRTAPLGLVLLTPVAGTISGTDKLLHTAWLFGKLNAVILLRWLGIFCPRIALSGLTDQCR